MHVQAVRDLDVELAQRPIKRGIAVIPANINTLSWVSEFCGALRGPQLTVWGSTGVAMRLGPIMWPQPVPSASPAPSALSPSNTIAFCGFPTQEQGTRRDSSWHTEGYKEEEEVCFWRCGWLGSTHPPASPVKVKVTAWGAPPTGLARTVTGAGRGGPPTPHTSGLQPQRTPPCPLPFRQVPEPSLPLMVLPGP